MHGGSSACLKGETSHCVPLYAPVEFDLWYDVIDKK